MVHYTAAQLKNAHKLQRTIESFQAKIDALTGKMAKILGGESSPAGKTGTRNFSAAGRARIAAAQRLRWAKLKGKPGRGARKMPASARAKISRAAKARWAKAKAAGRNSL